MYLLFFPLVASGLTRFLYGSWWRAALVFVLMLAFFVGTVKLLSLV